jgi:hypothetical protein
MPRSLPAVQAGGLHERIGQVLDVLGHEEDAEGIHGEGHDQPTVVVHEPEPAHHQVGGHENDLERKHESAQDRAEGCLAVREPELGEAVPGHAAEEEVAQHHRDRYHGAVDSASRTNAQRWMRGGLDTRSLD